MASLFTRILQKEIPGHFVWLDDLCFAIMTIEPIRRGHLLLIPRQEVDHWDALPADTLAHLSVTAQKIAGAMKQVIACKRIGMSVVGLEVPHTHIHLIPIDSMDDMNFSRAQMASGQELAASAAQIRQALREQGYTEAEPLP
ncbi:MAG: HIT family protein [Pseudomonadales bacterium]|nr:HIT family protein [Pseudomonadales bacterium]